MVSILALAEPFAYSTLAFLWVPGGRNWVTAQSIKATDLINAKARRPGRSASMSQE